MSEAPELKPCPFCGGEAVTVFDHTDEACHAYGCRTCSVWVDRYTADDPIAAWNRRADLVAAPSVTVKPLEWADLGDGTFRALLPIIGSIRVEPYGCCDWWEVLWSMPGQCDKLIPDVFDSPDDAKAAAQADYEARILAAIQIAPAPGWQTIATAPVGIPVLAYCYGGEILMTRITKHGEDEYARTPDLWMPLPKPPTKDSTHD